MRCPCGFSGFWIYRRVENNGAMIQNDWIKDAARELASHFSFGSGPDQYVTDEQRKNVADNYAAIIARHSPFEPDVAYLKIVPHKQGSIYDWAARAAIYLSAERLPSTHRIAAVISHFAEPLVKMLQTMKRKHEQQCPAFEEDDPFSKEEAPLCMCSCGAALWNNKIDKVLQGEPE